MSGKCLFVFQGVRYSKNNGRLNVYSVSGDMNGRSYYNGGYQPEPRSSYELSETNSPVPMRVQPNGRGQDNRAFIHSVVDDRSPSPNNNSNHIPIPAKRTLSHDHNRYSDDIVDGAGKTPSGCHCSKKRLCIGLAIPLAVILVGLAVVLSLYFGE